MAYPHYEGAPYCGCESCMAARKSARLEQLARAAGRVPLQGLILALRAVIEATRERGLDAVPLAALEEMVATLETLAKERGA